LELRRYGEATREYELVMRANPEIASARGGLLRCKIQICDWNGLDAHWKRALADIRSEKAPVPPMVVAALCSSAEDQLRCARLIGQRYFAGREPLSRGERYGHAKIRIAYVSSDFHAHATATLAAGLFEEHDRNRFETCAISFGRDDKSPMRRRLEGAFDHFIDIRDASDEDIAKRMRAMEIDIAVDLKALTTDSRPGIFARRPAPIQVSYLGYPGTMGVPYIDYLIADRVVIPEEETRHYSEAIVYLPDCYQPNDSRRQMAPQAPARSELGLPETGFVFCCFNNPYKITPVMFGIWMRLLKDIDGSILWLLEDSPAATDNLRRESAGRGVSPERLVFAPPMPPDVHLARHKAADLFLDTLPYNAHTTASDSLWAGVPLLTCLGTTFPGRVAASLLEAIAMPELITRSHEDYYAMALKLAREPDTLASLKSKLARNRETGSLFNTKRYARHLEAAYAKMVERQRRGEPPQGFAVDPLPEAKAIYCGAGP
jgi:predicted O-linked N-acetylglucosamine transferase (SPINDLY family)